MKKRVWELDFIRGGAIVIMIGIHLVVDLMLAGKLEYIESSFFWFVKLYGGIIFVLISGICAEFSKNNFKRGLVVFGCGMLLTIATVALYKLGICPEDILIQWGVLHLIGFSMMIYPLYKKLPRPIALILALVILAVGYYLRAEVWTINPYLLPLGIEPIAFKTRDWYPILPNTGWFMLGSLLSKLIYKEKKSLFPNGPEKNIIIRLFSWVGRNSLWIYLISQPLTYITANYLM